MDTPAVSRVNRPSSYPQSFGKPSSSSDARPAAVQLIKSAIDAVGNDGVGSHVNVYA